MFSCSRNMFYLQTDCKVNTWYTQIYIQQDATLHGLSISGNCSTCFGWYFHPSSGAHTTVFVKPLLLPVAVVEELELRCSSNSSTTATGSSNGLTSTVVCAPDDGWKYHPKHVEQFPEIDKLCNVVSSWIYISVHLRSTDQQTFNMWC